MSSTALANARNALATASGNQLTGYIRTIIKRAPVVVFSKSYCPHCRETKDKLFALDPTLVLIELDQEKNGPAIQDALAEISGQRTVPNIYIGQKHIGGNSDLQKKGKEVESLVAAALENQKNHDSENEGSNSGDDNKL